MTQEQKERLRAIIEKGARKMTSEDRAFVRELVVYVIQKSNKYGLKQGYRGFYLTKHIKGASKTSAHDYGLAADLVPLDGDIEAFKEFVPKFLKKSGLPYDQWIDEERTTIVKGVPQVSRWGHIGYKDRKSRQRRQNLITTDGKTYKPLGEV